MKIVLNGCYGGFGLSCEAQYLYLIAKGKTPYFYLDVSTYTDYTKNMRYKRISLAETSKVYNKYWVVCTSRDQGEVLDDYPSDVLVVSQIDRTDPDLVSVVEVLGDRASGQYASLEIHELPNGSLYKIDEYDGIESLITQEDDDWLVARDQTQSNKKLIENIWATIKPQEDNDGDLTFKY